MVASHPSLVYQLVLRGNAVHHFNAHADHYFLIFVIVLIVGVILRGLED